jgi:hypothetical protein
MRRPGLCSLVLLLFSCHHPIVYPAKIGHIRRVVILGNSIVQQPPLAAIGWNHNWGMAASAMDKDFVHLLIKDIHAKRPDVIVRFMNISGFERGYRFYDLTRLDSLRGADLYIFKLAENVADTATSFIAYYDNLIRYLDNQNGINIIVDGFWENPINGKLKDYAADYRLPFIRNSGLSGDKSMMAAGMYKNYGVSVHPSDKGMQAIEKRIWDYLQIYF